MTLKKKRVGRWMVLSLLLAGCAAEPPAVSQVQGTVQFELLQGEPQLVVVEVPRAAIATVTIIDSAGNTVRTMRQHNFVSTSLVDQAGAVASPVYCNWDGLDDIGHALPTGTYTAKVAATDGDPLQVTCAFVPSASTGSVTLRGNLSALGFPVRAFDPTSPKVTSDFVTAMTVYDSLGHAIQIDLYFVKNGPSDTRAGDDGDWTYFVTTDGANLAADAGGSPTTAGSPVEIAVGTLRFGPCGVLIENTTTLNAFYPKYGVAPQHIAFNFGTGVSSGGSGLDGLTQQASTSAVTFANQEGGPSYIDCVAAQLGVDGGSARAPGRPASGGRMPATARIGLRGNLDQTSEPTSFNPSDASATSNFSTSLVVYDALGAAIELDILFCKNAPDATQAGDSGDWRYHILTAAGFLASSSGEESWCGIVEVATGALRFDVAGRLISNAITTQPFVPRGAAKPQPLAFDFGTGTAVGGTGLDGLTQYAATSAISAIDVAPATSK